MIIRRMRPEDISQVVVIEQESFSQPWSENSFLDTLCREDTIYLVSEEAGEVCGYCGLWQSFSEGEIPNVAVKKEYRRQGIAKRLLSQLFVEGERRGIDAFTLEVRASNESAISLYESLGFESAGVRPKFYTKPVEDAVIMWKR